MTESHFDNIEKIENDLWDAADELRANSKLASSEYFLPVLGIIFLRHAANRFDTVTKQIEEDQASGKMPKRAVKKIDYLKRGALWLPEISRWQYIVSPPDKPHDDLRSVVFEAMEAIEQEYPEQLQNVLPKEYGGFGKTVFDDLIRIFNREILNTVSGDVFGRINEYFLMKFATAAAYDDGEFFTPPSLVQTIVNVIEPEHGIVFDPACGSCGMFVQSNYFIRRLGLDTAKRVVFKGQEKTATTIRIGKMNLAVHALSGELHETNTFDNDSFELAGKCDFLMANPPFNVNRVDAEKVKTDIRLPFGLPGINAEKKVSNANYLWISYFWSYLNPTGRAGFVMSSQASNAGNQEKEVRRKIVETGDVDVMIAIRSNFFYTRSVPCELWFFDRGKPEERRDRVLMIDARNVYRKVTRKIYDFSPAQEMNLTAIVWLYRGYTDRYLGLITSYFVTLCNVSTLVASPLSRFDQAYGEAETLLSPILNETGDAASTDSDLGQSYLEMKEAFALYHEDRKKLVSHIADFRGEYCSALPETNDLQQAARERYDPIADHMKGLIKQIDLIYRLVSRAIDQAQTALLRTDRRGLSRQIRELDEVRKESVHQLQYSISIYRQIVWLMDRFPDAKLIDVPGLVKLVSREEIAAADWSLSPGRYVGVAPPEEDEDFDFEQTLRDIHTELADLNAEAAKLAQVIQENFEEIGI